MAGWGGYKFGRKNSTAASRNDEDECLVRLGYAARLVNGAHKFSLSSVSEQLPVSEFLCIVVAAVVGATRFAPLDTVCALFANTACASVCFAL